MQAGGTRSKGYNAIVNPDNFSYNDDPDGYATENAGLNAVLPWAPGQEVAVQYFRNRLNNQFDGGAGFDDRTITTLEAWSVVSRNQLAQTLWTSMLTLGSGSDDSVSQTGFGDYPYKTTQRQYTWQNDITLPLGSLAVILERREERPRHRRPASPVTERDTNSVTGRLPAARTTRSRCRPTCATTTRTSTAAKPPAASRSATSSRRRGASRPGYSTGFKAPSFNDLYYPVFSNPNLQPETSRNAEVGRVLDVVAQASGAGRRAPSATTTRSTS